MSGAIPPTLQSPSFSPLGQTHEDLPQPRPTRPYPTPLQPITKQGPGHHAGPSLSSPTPTPHHKQHPHSSAHPPTHTHKRQPCKLTERAVNTGARCGIHTHTCRRAHPLRHRQLFTDFQRQTLTCDIHLNLLHTFAPAGAITAAHARASSVHRSALCKIQGRRLVNSHVQTSGTVK